MHSLRCFWNIGLVAIGMLLITGYAYGLNKKKCIVSAYSPYIYLDKGLIRTKHGEIIPWNDGLEKNYLQKVNNPDLEDTLSIPYPAFTSIKRPGFLEDPGRFRNQKLFEVVYGDIRHRIEKNLIYVSWVNGSQIKQVLFNQQNNAASALKKVIKELNQLPPSYQIYFNHLGGTYNYRIIAGTNRLSAHAFGIAIDLNVKKGDYWRYNRKNLSAKTIDFKNRIPQPIIDIFERHCFIWGGRWYHYDTMHFEYRPELFCNQC